MADSFKPDGFSSTATSHTFATRTTRTDFSGTKKSCSSTSKNAPEPVVSSAQDPTKAQSFRSTLIIDAKAPALKVAAMPGARCLPDPGAADPLKPNEQSHVSKKVFLDPALEEELSEGRLLDVPGLVEHLFPDRILPLPFESLRFVVMAHFWDQSKNTWKDTDPASATFLNRLSNTLIDAVSSFCPDFILPSDRIWVSECDLTLRGTLSDGKRKPGLCLVNTGRDATWSSTLVIVERKPKASDVADALTQLANGAYMIFSTQDPRRFHIGISICDNDVRVYVFDRAGAVGSTKFHLREHPHLLICLIAGLTLTDSGSIGFDSSIRSRENGTEYGSSWKRYYCLESPTRRRRLCIKDTWRDTSYSDTETGIMRLAAGLEGVVHLVADEIVQCNGEDGSTACIRSIIARIPDYCHKDLHRHLEVLLHTRIVVTPCAQASTSFKSKKELLTVFIDVIEAHRRLVEKNIMHCNISMSNVMIYRPTFSPTDTKVEAENNPSTSLGINITARTTKSTTPSSPQVTAHRTRGILIDLDNAVVTHDDKGNRKEGLDSCLGTLPFSATEVLMGLKPGEQHQAHHDLESFFYILLWICLKYAGPNGMKRTDIDISKDRQMKHWLEGNDMKELGEAKYTTTTTTPAHFHRIITTKCTPYFTDIVPCLEELRQKLFFGEESRRLTHQDIIDILCKPLDWLPNIDNGLDDKSPVVHSERPASAGLTE